MNRVGSLISENVLALLNLAAACLGPDESYAEIGVYHGASLIGAMLGNEDRDFVAVDDFAFRGATLERVERNLASFGLDVPEIIVGDVFELVPAGALGERRVGVWFYDASHSYEAQLEGLRMAEPWLVPEALLIVDDTDWVVVERALDDYLAEQPRARRALVVEGRDRGFPQWWEGVQALRWEG